MEVSSFSSSEFDQAVVDVHGNYRAARLTYEPPDELISDLVTARVMRPHIVRSVVFALTFVILLLVWLVVALVGVAGVASDPSRLLLGSSETDSSSLAGLLSFLGLLQVLVLLAWLVSFFVPVRESISEYGLLIEGRASAEAVAYEWVAETIRGRGSPFRFSQTRVSGVPVVQLRNGRDHGLVLVERRGSDLFMGWTMWRSRSTVLLVGHLLRDLFQASDPASDVRAASSRAFRELIHSVTREGVQAAIVNLPEEPGDARAWPNSLAPRHTYPNPQSPSAEYLPPPTRQGHPQEPSSVQWPTDQMTGPGSAGTNAGRAESFIPQTSQPAQAMQRSQRRHTIVLACALAVLLAGGVTSTVVSTRQPVLAGVDADGLYQPGLQVRNHVFVASSSDGLNFNDWPTDDKCSEAWSSWASRLNNADSVKLGNEGGDTDSSFLATYLMSNKKEAQAALDNSAMAWTACYPASGDDSEGGSGKVSGAAWAESRNSYGGQAFRGVFIQYGNTYTVHYQSLDGDGSDSVPVRELASALTKRIDELAK